MAVKKPEHEFDYVLKYIPDFDPLRLAGLLVANPGYSPKKDPHVGYSVGDWEVPPVEQMQNVDHWEQLKADIEADEWTIPVSGAAFRGQDGEPEVFLLSGRPIATVAKALARKIAIVVADHHNVYPDIEPVTKIGSVLPKSVKSWYNAAGWNYASVITGIIIPERKKQLFIG